MLLRTIVLACAVAAALSACSGSASNALVPGAANAGPAAPPAARSAGSVHARIVLRIPRSHRHGHYISPSTAAVGIAIKPASTCTACTPGFTLNAQLAPTSNACAVDPGTNGLTCTIEFALKPGSYTGSMATYDGWNATTSAPSGNVLSQNQSFPIKVAAGAANIPTITLAGIAHTIQVIPLSSDLAVINELGNADTRLEVVPQHAAQLLAEAFDADGNAIFGPGSPAFSVTVGGGYTVSVLGNNVRLTAPKNPVKGVLPITIATTTCAAGSTCSTQNWTISASPLVALASNTPTTAVQIYSGLNDKLYATIPASAGLSDPVAEAFDSKGDLFVANQTGGSGNHGSIAEYAPPYNETSPTSTITSGISTPTALTISSNDKLAVINSGGGGSIAVYASGGVTPISPPLATGGVPASIAFDAANNLWYATNGSGTIASLTAASGYAGAGPSVSAGGSPKSIALDNLNDVVVADGASGAVTEYKAPLYSTTDAVAASYTGTPQLAQALNPPASGSLHAGDSLIGTACATRLGEFDFDNSTSYTTFDDTNSGQELLAFDQDGTYWVSEAFNGGGDVYFYPTYKAQGLNTYTTYPPVALAVFPGP